MVGAADGGQDTIGSTWTVLEALKSLFLGLMPVDRNAFAKWVLEYQDAADRLGSQNPRPR
jgi:hypothetical protein